MRSPSPAEDARNLMLIAGSAFAAVLATIGLAEANTLSRRRTSGHRPPRPT